MSQPPPSKRHATELIVREEPDADVPSPPPPPTNVVLERGHTGAISALAFSVDGGALASASKDKTIGLWTLGATEIVNTFSVTGHTNAVTSVTWLKDQFATSSADQTVAVWDAATGARTRRFIGHSAIVNDVSAARGDAPLVASASDDGSVRVWDARTRRSVFAVTGAHPLLAVALSADGSSFFCAGTEGYVRAYELRGGGGADAVASMELAGHSDTILSLALSNAGTHLLSFSLDNSLRSWDVRPFAVGGRAVHVYSGATNSFELNRIGCAWSPEDDRVASGSADKLARVWDVDSTLLLSALPGHGAAVTAVAFAKDGRLATASNDRRIFLGAATTS